ncbi:thioesterase II family protein [Streptomyces sp. NPDC048111]|uniref:thioesterase II family protein n=1 Tax=Streptomyces sp. NPDC048111 TaxID=3365500 RepID=UPI0037105DE1
MASVVGSVGSVDAVDVAGVMGTGRAGPAPGTDPGPHALSVVRPRPVADPVMRIFLLHHAAGSHRVFADWVQHFPPDWEVCLLEAPGRRRLSALPALQDARALAAYFAQAIAPSLDRPYALFGHSMGAAVAYELTHRLDELGSRMPHWLGVSACRAPLLAAESWRGRPVHSLPDRELRTALAEMGGMPERALSDDDVWRRIAPRVRDDFRLAEGWRPRAARLPVGLSLFGGVRDPVVSARQLGAWSQATTRPGGQHFYRGGHFYFRGWVGGVVSRVVSEARRHGAPPP